MPYSTANQPRFGRQSGFSLFEILVAMIVIAIGVLGIAGLQASALRYSKASEMRYTAVQLTNELIERLRSNHAGAINGDFTSLGALAATTCNRQTAPPAPGTSPPSDQIKTWRNAVACSLPSGVGQAVITPATAEAGLANIVVTIQWDESRLRGGDLNQRLVTRTVL
jgi:type IV pilus assembly protein PilV